jgi:hypothetical protein
MQAVCADRARGIVVQSGCRPSSHTQHLGAPMLAREDGAPSIMQE